MAIIHLKCYTCLLSASEVQTKGALGLWSTSEFENNAKKGRRKSKTKSNILSSNNKRMPVAILRIVDSAKTKWVLFGKIEPEKPKEL